MTIPKSIRVEVYRFSPSTDKEPRYQVFEVPFIQRSSVMNVLDYIHDNLDSTLAYYGHSACYRGVCGRCTLTINEKASLACQTPVTGDLKIEPPKRAQIIRDLVYKL